MAYAWGMDIHAAIEKLDADLAQAEAEVLRLREMRRSIGPFLTDYAGITLGVTPPRESGEPNDAEADQGAIPSVSMLDRVVAVFEAAPAGSVFDIDDVWERVKMDGHGADAPRDSVRNSIHHAVRKDLVRKGAKRGTFVPLDTSTPERSMSGVEVSEESQEDSSCKEGGTEYGSDPPGDLEVPPWAV